jgi:hypothetical protein
MCCPFIATGIVFRGAGATGRRNRDTGAQLVSAEDARNDRTAKCTREERREDQAPQYG